MSSDATEITKTNNLETVNADAPEGVVASNKGKGKVAVPADDAMDEDDDDDDEDEEEEEEDDDDDDEEDLEEIDPTAIRSRRTRGVRVDYTSAEALEKAGLKPEDLDKDDD